MSSINRAVLTANLTHPPELRATPDGTPVCSLRVAFNTQRRNPHTGAWEPKPNYIDVTVWGKQADNCHRYLTKGRQIAVDGRLEWREWTTQDGQRRQAIELVAQHVQFLGTTPPGNEDVAQPSRGPAAADQPRPAAAAAVDDDIPF